MIMIMVMIMIMIMIRIMIMIMIMLLYYEHITTATSLLPLLARARKLPLRLPQKIT